jgi:CBS domain-containing protein/flagellar motility protein MotE (MotC chaperone)
MLTFRAAGDVLLVDTPAAAERQNPDNGTVSSVMGGNANGSASAAGAGGAVHAAGAAAGEGAAGRQVFTSRLQGRPFMDGEEVSIGRIRDVVLLPSVGGRPPRALGLVVQVRRRRIFVGLGRIGEIDAEGAHLVGGTVDLGGFTLRAGEVLASSLYGRHTSAGTVADIAIAPRETRRGAWEVTAVAVTTGRGLRSHGPSIVSWDSCRELFEADSLDRQLTSLREMEPADLATAFGALPVARRNQLAAALDDEELADLLEEMPEEEQVRLVNSLDLERGADVVEEMQPDDAADLLAEMTTEQRERLLTAMQSVQAEEVRRLLRYDAATAGGLMTSQPLIFGPDTTVAEVLAKIRNPAVLATAAAQVYVCEPPLETPTGTYLGSVGFQRLLRRPPAVPMGEVLEGRVYVRPDLPERELAVRLAAYNLMGVAVCDESGHLLGAVTIDDVLDRLLPEGWRQTRKGG